MTPSQVSIISPDFAAVVPPDTATWRALKDAAGAIAPDWGINQRLWRDAVAVMGVARAILALAVLTGRGRDYYTSPGGFFRRCLDRAEADTFDLMRSFNYLLHQRSGPKPVPASPEPGPAAPIELPPDLAARYDTRDWGHWNAVRRRQLVASEDQAARDWYYDYCQRNPLSFSQRERPPKATRH